MAYSFAWVRFHSVRFNIHVAFTFGSVQNLLNSNPFSSSAYPFRKYDLFMSTIVCKRVGFMYSYGAMFQCTIISAMLLLRCWALYDKKRVIWILCGGLGGSVISGIVIVKLLLDRTTFLDNPLPNIFSGCIVMIPDYVWILYIVPLIYESSLFFLTIWRIYGLSKDFGATPLMQTLAHNGTTYFATLVGIMILACIGGTIQPVKIAANASGVLSAMSSVICSRMIFSLYRINDGGIQEERTLSHTRDDLDESTIPRFAIPLQSLVSTTVSNNLSKPEQV
ncbi:unnamed protein product [Rhizoctonia solani]|uniref:Uncharacterized protein n=1 Tax=Rhizoctonia solani TaxID=456999 RepID=A0A8H3A5R9_9AGAM|nr:unnamed protein product [Rhizoctonia solani]